MGHVQLNVGQMPYHLVEHKKVRKNLRAERRLQKCMDVFLGDDIRDDMLPLVGGHASQSGPHSLAEAKAKAQANSDTTEQLT